MLTFGSADGFRFLRFTLSIDLRSLPIVLTNHVNRDALQRQKHFEVVVNARSDNRASTSFYFRRRFVMLITTKVL